MEEEHGITYELFILPKGIEFDQVFQLYNQITGNSGDREIC